MTDRALRDDLKTRALAHLASLQGREIRLRDLRKAMKISEDSREAAVLKLALDDLKADGKASNEGCRGRWRSTEPTQQVLPMPAKPVIPTTAEGWSTLLRDLSADDMAVLIHVASAEVCRRIVGERAGLGL